MTAKRGKIYGGSAGIFALFILNFTIPTTQIGNFVIVVVYAVTVVMTLMSAVLWFWNLKYSRSMGGTTFDNFVYTFTGVSYIFSMAVAISKGQLPS